MTAAKDIRLVVRLSEELLAWYNAEAAKVEMPTAAYVRMVLAERRNGSVKEFPESILRTTLPNLIEPSNLKPFVFSPDVTEALPSENEDPLPVPDIDLDALVAEQVQTAEASGATAPMDNGYGGFVEPDPGVRVLQQHRRQPGKEWGSRI